MNGIESDITPENWLDQFNNLGDYSTKVIYHVYAYED